MKRLFFFALTCFLALSLSAQNYVDLGLSSGTKWSTENEKIGLVTSDMALSKFLKNLPTKTQWEELLAECTWKWNGKGYLATGPNGKSIFFPAAGMVAPGDKTPTEVGESGGYWSRTPFMVEGEVLDDYVWALDFESDRVYMFNNYGLWACSVRLVKSDY